jgi:hypothetical protein
VLPYSFNFIITASESSGQPLLATVPFTSGHLSSLSKTPSPVSGKGQPAFSFGPATVGHLSSVLLHLYQCLDTLSMQQNKYVWTSIIHISNPSPSVSGQPFNVAKPNTSGQASALSWIPSPSVSGQPLNSFKPATSGHASSLSYIPSPSVSFPPNLKVRPAVC